MPSKYHAGMPAIDSTNQLNLVTMQWAARDPLDGYSSSLYSTQDYQTKPLDYTTDFFDSLIKTYGLKHDNSFGQITVGLEGDFNPNDYDGEYTNQIQTIKHYVDQEVITPVTMSQFSDWYRKIFARTEPTFIQSDKGDNSGMQSYWYQSSRYRMNILYDSTNQQTIIRDLRTYHTDLFEPYYSSRNNSSKLIINIPSYFDALNNKEDVWSLELGKRIEVTSGDGKANMKFEKGSLTFDPLSLTISQQNLQVPQSIQSSQSLDLVSSNGNITIRPRDRWSSSSGDATYYALSEVSLHELGRKRTKGIIAIGIALWFVAVFRIVMRVKDKLKMLVLILIITV